MTMQALARRTVLKVPAALVAILADEGKVKLPPEPQAGLAGFRRPTLTDLDRLTWYACTDGYMFTVSGALRCVLGAAAVEDRYDFHTASDVREIAFLTGTPRALALLISKLREEAQEDGRRLVGSIDVGNAGLRRFLGRIKTTETRVMVEDFV